MLHVLLVSLEEIEPNGNPTQKHLLTFATQATKAHPQVIAKHPESQNFIFVFKKCSCGNKQDATLTYCTQ